MGLIDAVEMLESYLRYQAEEGTAEVPVAPAVVKELGAPPPRRPVRSIRREGEKPEGEATQTLDTLAAAIAECVQCSLHKTRTRTVPGQGSARPDIMFIGEAPGADEDRQGLAFVGRAGQLLTKMIEAMGCTREEVFIGNILKCRPPGNRAPLPDEMDTCIPYLKAQIKVLQPKVIVALGATAVKGLLGVSTGITKLRGRWHTFEGIDLMPTFHPAYLLRNPPAKHEAWEDLKEVLKHLGRTPPPVKKSANR